MTLERQLQQNGYVLTMSVGVSMRPMLMQRTEQLLIEKLSTAPKQNDVVLFRRNNGQYVLHRVIGKRKEAYLIRGDNCYKTETVNAQQLVGILTGFYRGNRYVDCKLNKAYRCYSVFWRISYPLRFAAHHILQLIRRILSRLRR